MGSQSFEPSTPECSLCGGDGYTLNAQRQAVPCRCAIERKIRSLLPERYHEARLQDFRGPALDSVLSWVSCPGDGLFLTGSVGTGKTHLAAAITRHLFEGKASVAFQRCAEFYAAVREMYRREESEALLLSPLLTPRFLILDDLGAGSLSDSERRFTLEVLDRRANRLKPTVVTSNWSLQEIAEKLDDRVASRLSGFTRLELSGQDRRMRP